MQFSELYNVTVFYNIVMVFNRRELYLNKVSGKVPEGVFENLNSSFLLNKSTSQDFVIHWNF